MQPQEFLSIKEAAERYSKAEITIRRFVRNVLKNSSAKERQMIRPLPDEAAKLKKKGRPFAYTINESLLKEKFFAEQGMEKTPKAEIPPAEYMSLLQRTNAGLLEQLKVKDDQIKALNSSLEGLSERQRETNVLMKILEERLLLPAPTVKKSWWAWGKAK